jgi:O-methyltransferase
MTRFLSRLRGKPMSAERTKQEWLDGAHEGFRTEQRRSIFRSISIFCYHNQPIDGYYFEFGCHKARTMRLAWDEFHSLYDWTYVAFDSFEGLPEMDEIDRMPIWKKGDLKTTESSFINTVVKHGMPREKLKTIKGFYDESLTERLKEELAPAKAAVIYIDCDLYSSTSTALRFCKGFLQRGTVLVFDDWFCFCGDPERGERRAFQEFLDENPELRFQEYIQTNEAKAFIYLGERGPEAGNGRNNGYNNGK